MSENYQPGRAYWKEVDKLDRSLYWWGSKSFRHMFSSPLPLTVMSRMAWQGEQAYQKMQWRGVRSLGIIGLTSSLVAIDKLPSSKERPPEVLDPGKVIHYNANVFGLRDPAHVYTVAPHHIEGDYAQNLEEIRRIKRSGEMQRELGLSTLGEEDFDLLINELRRGASGEFDLEYDN